MLGKTNTFRRRAIASGRGFTLIELVMSVAVAVILTAISVPLITTAVSTYKIRSAATTVSGAIQSARHRSIFLGYPLQLTISKDNHNYQLAGKDLGAGASTFSNIGGTVPFSNAVTLNQNVVLQFSPGGSVQATTGTLVLVMTYGSRTETITVSGFGNVNVKEQ